MSDWVEGAVPGLSEQALRVCKELVIGREGWVPLLMLKFAQDGFDFGSEGN